MLCWSHDPTQDFESDLQSDALFDASLQCEFIWTLSTFDEKS